ncbi:zf-RING_2 domain-containing protein [Cephalotus follicularis]|uniref:Zf-RING_2 domain-containing protein n=1 Tax=Cephalotus follicularis TaxID=3775 RepID=A0A1Q3D203_CEPFO|nr:zf-RING_2 domain-containing protein [Cephalotus follicularis]
MTSASELFYVRRSRVGRPDPDPDSCLPNSESNHRRHHHRHALDGGDPLRRSPQVLSTCHRPSSSSESASVRFNQDTSPYVSSNSVSAETSSSSRSPRLTMNERLPGAVLLARARLLERLRGVSISENRQSGRGTSSTNRRDYILGDDLRLMGAGDWGTVISAGQSDGGLPITDAAHETKKKKPPGLTQEALDCLNLEVFCNLDRVTKRDVLRASWDCSICLESFVEGDELIRLACGHSFHAACLDPWVRTCGDCPYCRRVIYVRIHNHKESTES